MVKESSMIDFQVHENQIALKQKLEYVLKTFNDLYSVTKKTTISYGSIMDDSVVIMPANEGEFFDRNEPEPKNICFSLWEGKEIPFLFHNSVNELIKKNTETSSVVISADILLSAFYFLSCWQEHTSNEEDSMGRFPYKSSMIGKLGIAKIPVVNYYFDILKKAIQEFHGNESVISYRQQLGLKVGLTHDIDQCKTGWKEENFRRLIDGKIISGISKIISRPFNNDVWFNFSSIMEHEQKKSISSSFYFIAEKQKAGSYPNADYMIESPEMNSRVNELISEGFEVGIHGSIGTGFDLEKFRAEIQKFQSEELGGRFHYLMMRIPETWKIIEESELTYDSTLGFAEMIGFRNGFCYPFQPYDFENDKHFTFWEYPMNVMDKTLMQPEYLHLDPGEAVKNVQGLINEIQKWNGYATLNWHNNTLSGYKYREWVNVYHEIIDYCLSINGSISSIMNHYKNMQK
jgi:hypothetical protein